MKQPQQQSESKGFGANRILHGDVRTKLTEIGDASIDCVITSPPYFRLRNYGTDDQIGLEDHIDGWVKQLRDVFVDLARVLKPSGAVWLNIGDSYSRDDRAGSPAKSLLLAPERLLMALAADGWIVRNKIVWAKTNPMPNSVRDRLSCTHEFVYFLTRSPKYLFDLDAIRTPHKSGKTPTVRREASYPPIQSAPPDWAGPLTGNNSGLTAMKRSGLRGHPLGKNPGDVWAISTANFRGAHFATFPTGLVEPPLLATCPERVCSKCGLPWQRNKPSSGKRTSQVRDLGHLAVQGKLRPTCACKAEYQPGVVLDPFFGAGTVGIVAEQHGRNWLGIEISDEFVRLAEQRIELARTKRNQQTVKQSNGQQQTKRAA